MNYEKLCISICTALAVGSTVGAADMQLAPVIVSAERCIVQGTLAQDTLASATVRTRADFERMGARSLSAALRAMPGVSMSSFGADHVDYDNHGTEVRLRGAAAVATILVNGVPLGVNTRLPLSSLPLEAVERIEVLPNEAAAYGTGGAINIVTATDRPYAADIRLGLRQSDRDDRTLTADLTAPDLRLGIRHLRDGGTAQTSAADEHGIYDHRRPSQQASVYAAWDMSPHWTIFADHSRMRAVWGETDPRGKDGWDGRWEINTSYLTVMYHTDRTRLIFGYADRTRYYTTYPDDGSVNISGTDYRARTWRADWQRELIRTPHLQGTLRAGLGTERYRGLRGSDRHGTRTQWDGEIALHWTPNDRYDSRFVLGVSLVDDVAGHTVVGLPKWEQRYRMNARDEWYTALSRSFAMPSISDYFNRMESEDAHTPETARRMEAGWRRNGDTVQWQLAVFHTDVDHKIDKHRIRGKIHITRIGQVRTDGVELSCRYQSGAHWYGSATLTYADAREQSNAGAPFVRSGAHWLGAAEIGYRTDKWDFNLNGNTLIDRPDGIAPLLLLNCQARCELSPAATLRIGIDNILNRRDLARDSRRTSFYTDPRRITFGLDYHFR